jgi:hypothetical protein
LEAGDVGMTKPAYRGAHQAIRKALMPYSIGRPCHFCGKPMLPGQVLDLDHRPDGGGGYRGMSHAVCNRRDGGKRAKLGRTNRRKLVMDLPRVVVAAETSWDRRHTSICAAGWDAAAGVWRAELVDYVPGTDVVGRLLELRRRPNVRALTADPVSPAAPIADALRRRSSRPEPGVRDIATATGEFIDALRAGEVRLAEQPVLTNAARHVEVRQTAAGIAFDRRGDVDSSPVVAAALALWAARRLRTPQIQ